MAPTWSWTFVTFILCLAYGALIADAQSCSKTVSNRVFVQCQNLPSLGASYAWTLIDATNTLHFAFTETLQDSTGWVGWGINPNAPEMQGTQALVAFKNSTTVTVKTYDVTAAVQAGSSILVPGPVSLNYSNISAVMSTSGLVTIFGTLQLAVGQSVSLNHVWNRGPTVNLKNDQLTQHDLANGNLLSTAVIDMSSGATTNVGLPYQRLKNIHGLVNAIGWGILLPIGVMAARYLRPFQWADPAWFYVHIICQVSGYTLGVVGWGLGLRLLHVSNTVNSEHKDLGIAIFTLATLQITAIVLRPKKLSKVRTFWNVWHHTIGYATIILIIINIFKGISILSPATKWKRAYVTILICLALIAVVLELVTWSVWFHRRAKNRRRDIDGNFKTGAA